MYFSNNYNNKSEDEKVGISITFEKHPIFLTPVYKTKIIKSNKWTNKKKNGP